MRDLHDKLRRFFDYVDASSAHAWEYWKKVPPIQMGDYLVKHTEDVIKGLTTGDGDVKKRCIELAFITFVLFEKNAEILNTVAPSIKSSAAVEVQGASKDEELARKDKEDWMKKRGIKPTNEDWRG